MQYPSKNRDQIARTEAEMLRLIRVKNGLSQAQIARQLELAPSTVGLYVDRLKNEGFLREGGKQKVEGRGRPARNLVVAPRAGSFVGVDVTKRFVRMIKMDFAEKVRQEQREEIEPEGSFARVLEKVMALAQSGPSAGPLLGAGVAVPSSVPIDEPGRGRRHHLRDWDFDALDGAFEEEFSIRARRDNSHRAMAAAELWFGAGRDVDNFVSLSARTGIGATLVLGGEPLEGTTRKAGNIGYWSCPKGLLPPSSCRYLEPGKRGEDPTLAELCSIPGLLERVEESLERCTDSVLNETGGAVLFGDLLRARRTGDELAVAHTDSAAIGLGWAAARLAELVDPELFVVSGPVLSLGEDFVQTLSRTLTVQFGPDGRQPPPVVASELGEYAGAMGAAAVALHHWTPER